MEEEEIARERERDRWKNPSRFSLCSGKIENLNIKAEASFGNSRVASSQAEIERAPFDKVVQGRKTFGVSTRRRNKRKKKICTSVDTNEVVSDTRVYSVRLHSKRNAGVSLLFRPVSTCIDIASMLHRRRIYRSVAIVGRMPVRAWEELQIGEYEERSKIGEIAVPVIGSNVLRCYQTSVTKTVTAEIFTGLATFRPNRTGRSLYKRLCNGTTRRGELAASKRACEFNRLISNWEFVGRQGKR